MDRFRAVAETGSTNADLRALAGSGAPDGLWLRADRQSAGKGRMGRDWQSPLGNFYGSTLVRLTPDDPPAATLALVAAVAVHQALAALAPALQLWIKWPNDILCQGAKMAGILLEREGDAVIIGIGVNLAFHPEGLGRPVTSLLAQGVAAPTAADFQLRLAATLDAAIVLWREQGLGPVRQDWLSRAHPIGTPLSASGGDGVALTGSFDGLAEDGALNLRLADGHVRAIHAGDIFLI